MAGAIKVYERIMNDEEARDYLACSCDCHDWSETTVNDFIWFDAEQILIDEGIWTEDE